MIDVSRRLSPALPLLLASLAALIFALAPARAADRDRLEAFLHVTGFDVALESIKLSAGAAPDMLGIDPGIFGSEWTRVSRDVFDVPLMHDMALDILEETLSDDLLTHAADFYASPLGQRLVEVENASHLREDDEAKRDEGRALVGQWVQEGNPRLETIKRMNAAIDSTGSGARAFQEIRYRFLIAASAAGVLELRVDPDDLRALLARDEDRLRLALQESGLANAAYTYQSFSDADLVAYAEALEHPMMQEVYVLMNAVQYEIMANRFEVLATRMAELQPGQEL
ncbi:DUF2059 domain-containing protein [Aestuariivita boseongensis]|uniref:DUF2059 domain-containing protein n=1 Tax=Aestuariivita boseongensis TaxID=1470562 RepID=UPI000682FA8E|nr:DUF2059 domain-containing protein [Aestuariivita boseongensis]